MTAFFSFQIRAIATAGVNNTRKVCHLVDTEVQLLSSAKSCSSPSSHKRGLVTVFFSLFSLLTVITFLYCSKIQAVWGKKVVSRGQGFTSHCDVIMTDLRPSQTFLSFSFFSFFFAWRRPDTNRSQIPYLACTSLAKRLILMTAVVPRSRSNS